MEVANIAGMLGVRRHMLDYAGFTALDFVYAVVVVRCAGVDILGFIYRSRQISLRGLLGEIRS